MIVKFSTRYGQITMLGEPARRLLVLGGHSGTVPGAILAAELPAFLARLRSGLAESGDEVSPAPPPREADSDDREEDEFKERPVSLRNRAVPLIELTATAIANGSDLMWDQA